MIVQKRLLTLMFLILASSCVTEKGEVSVKLPGVKTYKDSQIYNATVTNIQIINNQIVITGNNLNIVTNIKTENASKSFMKDFVIESKSNSQIIANSTSPISFAANELFKLVISNSYGAASFDISFNLCNSTLNGRALDCTVTAQDKDVLSYDAATQTWKPRAVNGLNYLGSFDASPGTAPTAQPSGSYYIISVAGTISGINFEVGDWIVSNGSAYQKIDNSTAITSVFGRTGAVVALEGDYSLDKLLDVDLTVAPVAGKILKYDGTKWVAGDDLSGGGAGSVSSTEITDGAVATVDLANLAVTDAKINDVAAGKITGTLTGTQIGVGAITNSHVAAGAAIDYSKLNIPAGSIPYTHLNIAAGEIPQDRINGLSTSLSALIEDAINDSMITKAPSQNAVFDALGLKADRSGVAQTITALAVTGLSAPIADNDAASKLYVDTQRDTRVLKTGDTMSGNLTLETSLLLKGGANYVTVRASAATSSYTLTLPTTAGTNGYVLQTDGSGILSWMNPSTMPAGSSTVNSAAITDGSIVDADINVLANIAQSKIAGLTTDLSNKQPLDAGLTNLSSYNTNGFLVQTADNTFVGRQILGTVNRVNVSNSDGSSGNVQIDINTSLLPNPVTAGHFLKATGANNSAWSALTSGEVTTALGFTPVNKAGDTLSTGNLTVNGTAHIVLPAPTLLTDPTTKDYVDTQIAGAANQWAQSSGNVYRTTGRVGIGTSSPAYDLEVQITETGGVNLKDSAATGGRLFFGEGTSTANLFSPTVLGTSVGVNRSMLIVGEAKVAEDTGLTPVTSFVARRDDNAAIVNRALFDWKNSSTALMTMLANGNLGIGTVTPSTKLNVYKDLGGAGGGVTIARIEGQNTGDNNYNLLDMNHGSSNVFRVTGAGFVGVGATTPIAPVDIVRDTSSWMRIQQASADTNGPAVGFFKSRGAVAAPAAVNSGDRIMGLYGTGYHSGGAFGGNAAAIQMLAAENFTATAQGTKIDFGTTSIGATARSTRMTIDSTGFVGVGTINPISKFNVYGVGGKDEGITVSSSGGNGPTVTLAAGANTPDAGALLFGDATNWKFHIGRRSDDGATKFLSIRSLDGNVGLGVTDPQAKLEFNQSTWIGFNSAQQKNGFYFNEVGAMSADGTGTTHGARIFYDGTADSLRLVTREAGVENAGLNISRATGHVGINIATPLYKLDVAGEVTLGTERNWAIRDNGSGSELVFEFHDTGSLNDTNIKYRVYSNGNALLAGTLTQSSDQRLKKNLHPIQNSLEKILSLDGIYYQWNDTNKDQKRQVGLIAQNVQKEFPEAVLEGSDGYLSVAYQNLVAPLIEAVKEIYNKHIVELWKENKRQDRAIASIEQKYEKKMNKLESENRALKSDNELMKTYFCQKDPKAPFCQKP